MFFDIRLYLTYRTESNRIKLRLIYLSTLKSVLDSSLSSMVNKELGFLWSDLNDN